MASNPGLRVALVCAFFRSASMSSEYIGALQAPRAIAAHRCILWYAESPSPAACGPAVYSAAGRHDVNEATRHPDAGPYHWGYAPLDPFVRSAVRYGVPL